MAIINKIITSYNYKKIDELFDFFMITTSDKYISSGAYILDKPVDVLKAESVAFDNGRSLFIMFKKNTISRLKLIDSIEDEKITIKQLYSQDIKDYILFRLFMHSLSNFNCDSLKFNNISGKLFIVKPSWVSKKKDRFKALNINIDSEMNIYAEAVSFTRLDLFRQSKKLIEYPKYSFSNKNNSLKRELHPLKDDEVFIRKSIYGRKVEIPFFCFSKKDLFDNKVYFIYQVLNLLHEKYDELLSIKLENIDVALSYTKSHDELFTINALKVFNKRPTNFINYIKGSEYFDCFDDVVDVFRDKTNGNILIGDSIKEECNNIVFIHNKEYYEENKYDDPYKSFKREEIIQCITVEDTSEKIISDNDAIINSIIKECVIKNDLLNNRTFSLDNWKKYNYTSKWIFGKEKDGKHYFIIVDPEGHFTFKYKLYDFNSFDDKLLDKCSNYLIANKGKEKTIVADDKGNINIISRTSKFTLPSKELFTVDVISRSKEARNKYLSGVVDINYFEFENGEFYYNVGIKGSGMNTSIPKASLLYKSDVIEGKNVIPDILETMSVTFVKYKSFTVLPYPIKYLNELILMMESNNN